MSLFVVVFLIFSPVILGLIALYVWGHWFRPKIGEPPVKEYMLRAAGESSRRLIALLNEKMLEDALWVAGVPAVTTGLYLQQQLQRGGEGGSGWWVFFLCNTLVVGWKGRSLVRRLVEVRNRELGCAGEQLVAERLAPLAQQGCLIFHDCPADGHGNIDHIVVAPSAVYAIETKTRRKRASANPGHATGNVVYDGCGLDYPHGREDFGLNQARRQARWLAELLGRALAEPVEVKAVLALPGWMVRRKGRGDVAVVNPKELPALIGEKRPVLIGSAAARRMQQIAFVLDGRCRDVIFGHSAAGAGLEVAKKPRPLRVVRPCHAATGQ